MNNPLENQILGQARNSTMKAPDFINIKRNQQREIYLEQLYPKRKRPQYFKVIQSPLEQIGLPQQQYNKENQKIKDEENIQLNPFKLQSPQKSKKFTKQNIKLVMVNVKQLDDYELQDVTMQNSTVTNMVFKNLNKMLENFDQ
ncbi:Hypothetical_protein [Hexamita inflata]|uniref:Hypothetical_protein n=1 Tax=Hexamita inflata TaxID=28002 RepID=A0AA86UYH7_9EUKA|nr:Hypothetical protein HINF_LOCUS64785 [Hexamita inflata]